MTREGSGSRWPSPQTSRWLPPLTVSGGWSCWMSSGGLAFGCGRVGDVCDGGDDDDDVVMVMML